MKVHGDIESVNLGTGETKRRVVGNGESRLVSADISFERAIALLKWCQEELNPADECFGSVSSFLDAFDLQLNAK